MRARSVATRWPCSSEWTASDVGALLMSHDPPPSTLQAEVIDLDTDATLLARAVDDPRAASVLVRRHQATLTRFVSRMLGVDDPDVDDVVQQAFIDALGQPGRYDQQSSVRTWLVGIAHNKARMAIRTRSRRRRVYGLFHAARSLWPAATTPPVHARQIGARIQEAIATLDPDRRAVFLLTEVEGFTSREAAIAVGAPEGTVRRWRTEARQQLRPLLSDLHESEERP